jgi:hypothetical protein
MNIDIIIYAVLAVIILSRLWGAFGTRNDEDRQRPNPFARPEVKPDTPSPDEAFLGKPKIDGEQPPMLRALRAAPDSLAGGLEQIRSLDLSFSEKQFLQGARSAFAMVIDDFFKGDLSNSTRLLGPAVRAQFTAAIEARRKDGHGIEHKLGRLKDVETAAVRLEDTQAFITVRYVSEQTNITRDASGTIISGEVGKLEEITELWTYTRDMTSPDPNWTLIETKS